MQAKPMLYLKQCPRCKGDMHMNRDIYGTYKECLQCGHMVDIEKPNRFAPVAVARARKSAA